MAESEEDVQRRIAEAWWAGVEGKPDSELAHGAGSGVGQEPAWRLQAQAALVVRLRASIEGLRTETAKSTARIERITWVLVVLTLVIVVMTGVLIAKA